MPSPAPIDYNDSDFGTRYDIDTVGIDGAAPFADQLREGFVFSTWA